MSKHSHLTLQSTNAVGSHVDEEKLKEALLQGTYEVSLQDGVLNLRIVEENDKIPLKGDDLDLADISEKYGVEIKTIYIPSEEKYVRRTKDEFKAGAEPVSGTSHRMTKVGAYVLPELEEAAKCDATSHGVKFAQWMRAAMRKALREGIDPEHELTSPVHYIPQETKKSDNEPS